MQQPARHNPTFPNSPRRHGGRQRIRASLARAGLYSWLKPLRPSGRAKVQRQWHGRRLFLSKGRLRHRLWTVIHRRAVRAFTDMQRAVPGERRLHSNALETSNSRK